MGSQNQLSLTAEDHVRLTINDNIANTTDLSYLSRMK